MIILKLLAINSSLFMRIYVHFICRLFSAFRYAYLERIGGGVVVRD